MGEFATQKLVNKTRNFCLIVEELAELASIKGEISPLPWQVFS